MVSATDTRKESRSIDESADDLLRLRSLILGYDYERTLRYWKDADETQRVAKVLAEAIRLRSQEDKSVQNALAPAIDDVLDASIQRDPVKLAHVIAPIIGPSIRNAVRTALSEMVESLNQILDRSISPRSLMWRVQAWRAGVPFGEFVLLRTLQYRVEQILVVHRDTGILLHSETAPKVTARDPDLVSAMLSAINGFVSDSFGSAGDDADIQQVRFGDRLLMIDVGAQAIIAAVIQGDPPVRIASQLKTTLEQFHRIYSQALTKFSGDRDAFASSSSLLQDCISEKFVSETASGKPWLAIALISLVMIGLSYVGWRTWDIHRQQDAIIRQLTSNDSYVLLGVKKAGNALNLRVLSRFGAPPARSVVSLSASSDIDLSIQETQVSMNPEDLLLPYLERRYALGTHTRLTVSNGVLAINGPLTQQQMAQIRSDSWVQGLVKRVDDSAVKWVAPPDQRAIDEEKWRSLVNQLQNTRFYFAPNASVLEEGEVSKLVTTLHLIRNLNALSTALEREQFQIVVTGYADTTGSDATNARLSRDRAQRVRDMLIENQIAPALLVSVGVGSLGDSQIESSRKRFAALQVVH